MATITRSTYGHVQMLFVFSLLFYLYLIKNIYKTAESRHNLRISMLLIFIAAELLNFLIVLELNMLLF